MWCSGHSDTYSAHTVDDGSRALRLLAVVEAGLFAHQRPQLVQVYGRAVGGVLLLMEIPHSNLSKVPRMARIWGERHILLVHNRHLNSTKISQRVPWSPNEPSEINMHVCSKQQASCDDTQALSGKFKVPGQQQYIIWHRNCTTNCNTAKVQ